MRQTAQHEMFLKYFKICQHHQILPKQPGFKTNVGISQNKPNVPFNFKIDQFLNFPFSQGYYQRIIRVLINFFLKTQIELKIHPNFQKGETHESQHFHYLSKFRNEEFQKGRTKNFGFGMCFYGGALIFRTRAWIAFCW